jgi:hypothetical protein
VLTSWHLVGPSEARTTAEPSEAPVRTLWVLRLASCLVASCLVASCLSCFASLNPHPWGVSLRSTLAWLSVLTSFGPSLGSDQKVLSFKDGLSKPKVRTFVALSSFTWFGPRDQRPLVSTVPNSDTDRPRVLWTDNSFPLLLRRLRRSKTQSGTS